ncbi:MAG TPA: alpha/beta hydrolase [Tepidiformaceae bacterium]|nr:alpha/beta hydrolase [Tepidiformaceae bacterium]
MEQQSNVIEFDHYTAPVVSKGAGGAVLYLHGFEGPQDGPFLDGLAARGRVFAPTHPGFAGSPTHPDIHDVHNVVAFYLELLDRLGLFHIDLIGHSLGGMFAAEIAAMIPERVRRVVLVSPFIFWDDEAPLPDVLATGGSALSRMLWANPDSDVAARYQPTAFQRTCNWAAATNYLWPLPDRGLAARIHRVKSPTLLVRGDADGVVSNDYLSACERLLPCATRAEIANAGHLSMLEQPEAFVQTVNAFLDS